MNFFEKKELPFVRRVQSFVAVFPRFAPWKQRSRKKNEEREKGNRLKSLFASLAHQSIALKIDKEPIEISRSKFIVLASDPENRWWKSGKKDLAISEGERDTFVLISIEFRAIATSIRLNRRACTSSTDTDVHRQFVQFVQWNSDIGECILLLNFPLEYK